MYYDSSMTIQDILNKLNQMANPGSSQSSNTRSSNTRSSNTRSRPFKIPSRGVFIIVLLLLIVAAGITSFFIVDATEQAVLLRLGRYNRTLGSGLHFKLPLGIERNYNVPTQIIQNQTFGFRTTKAGVVSQRSLGDFSNESTMLTGDLNIINVEWIIQYRIIDPRAWLFNVNNNHKTIRDISISAVNQLVGDYYITDVLGDSRTAIEETALIRMNNFFKDYQLGITVTAVRLQNIVPPEGRVQDAFEDVNKAVQDMNRLINEGREEYNKEIPKSRGQAEQLIQQAQGYSAERINQAEGDVARFQSVLQEYNRNPTITRTRLYFETVESILNSENTGQTQFVDSTFDNLVPLLPLSNKANTTTLKPAQ